MEEKKIIYKSIDEQLAEVEAKRAAAEPVSSGKTVERTAAGPKRGRKKLRLKKSVRRTIGSLMLATSIVVGAIPVGGVSADSSGVYKGSTAVAPDLSAISTTAADCVARESECTVPVSTGTHFGGFPLNAQPDGAGGYIKEMIGGKPFYLVDTNGYNDTSNPRPVYALDSNKTNIEYYFEKNGTDQYNPPGNKLNLVIGYVTDTTAKQWTYEGRLYKSEPVTYDLKKNDDTAYGEVLYGKKISIYDKVEVVLHHVKFVGDGDGEDILFETDVPHGDKVTGYPTAPPSKKGGTFVSYSPDPTLQIIDQDRTFTANYTYPSPRPSNEPESLEGASAEGGQEGDSAPGEEAAVENPDESQNVENGENTGDPEQTQEGGQPQEGNAGSGEEQTENSDPGESVEEEDHEIEGADAGNFGLTGVLLAQTVDGIDYNDDPTQVIYVCDEQKNITNICDNSFENTTSVRTVELPSNIQKIGNSSFKKSGVTSITLGTGITSIGVSAFEDCQSLGSVNYVDGMTLATIGAKAFANSALTTMSNGGSGISIPYPVSKIGDAAFYHTLMTELDFKSVVGCTVGDYAFARNEKLTKADLNNPNQLSISNLDGGAAGHQAGSVEGMFCEDKALKDVTMPYNFSGKINPGLFGTCEAIDHVKFIDGNGTFTDGEFDKWQITIEGPKPSHTGGNKGDYLNPSGNGSKSYMSCLDATNDYVYRYFDTDASQHEIANQAVYTPDASKDFFKDKTGFVKNRDLIFDVKEPDYTLTAYFDVAPTVKADLEIGNNIGQRNDGDIPVLAIGDHVFENDKAIHLLQLNSNLNNIGDSAFKNTEIVKLWATVDGTTFSANSFADNALLERATFAYGGEHGSVLGENSFGNTPKLSNVDFYDDNLTTGDKAQYARFFAGSIASNAFFTGSRPVTDELTFKGPMLEGYAPYEFAIDPGSKISNNLMFTKYYSGNPWNLTAQYQVEAFEKVNPVTGKTEKYSGVCLLNYPNMSSKMDKDDIEDTGSTVTVTSLEAIPAATRTQMQQDCIQFTHNIVVPYGIDYIDIAKTKRNDYEAVGQYFVFDDTKDLYYKTGGTHYNIFKYNPDINTVTFMPGGVSEFPDRMFEGCRNLEAVEFKGDVTNLGKLPFYMPDTEALGTKYSKYEPDSFPHLGPGNNDDTEFRSHLESVRFTGEADTGTKDNEKYYSSTDEYGSSTGILKGDNGSRVKVVQIVPSRGDHCGGESITADELADVDEYADYAARDCDAIKTVVFPDDGCDISYGCFMDCDRLKNVTMPNKFFAARDRSFAGISTNMDVTFPYNNVNLEELPFQSKSKDGLTMPDVMFHVHKDAEYLMDYADKNDNINYETMADAVKLTYRDRYDDTYYQVVDAMANGYTFGSNYPPAVLPSHLGENPTTWTGIDKNGNTVDWKTDVLTTDTTFTSVYEESDKITITFEYDDGEFLDEVKIAKNTVFTKDMMPDFPQVYKGRKYSYISNNPVGKSYTETPSRPVIIHYEDSGSSSTSTTSTTSSTGGGSTGSTGGGSTSTTGKSSSSSSGKSSSSSSSVYPVYVNSRDAFIASPGMAGTVADAGVGSTVYVDNGSGSGSGGSGSGSGGNGKKGSGNASVISTTGGISDTGKISATVNGSSDNYVIKITQTQEADDMGLAALHSAYGDDISPIRYLTFDISLYDATGTNKISPVPEGVSVSVTMPIPDDLAIYGGNAKIASTAGGVLDKMTPRFTVINGVPCMTYTCTHFSPYMVYVDTNNLTEAGIADMTPKTADGIHPKWFLCFGLAAIAVVMFLKKDPEEYLKKAA
ncbi:MAG: leucine-rich repeat protein [Lachnospiraceae bacterium]|nr:leucine-rich repeat protein [Lachnospiraceae bacterium]